MKRTKDSIARTEAMLQFIKNYIAERGYAPTVWNIKSGCDLSSSSVVLYHLNILEHDGRIVRQPKIARSIIVLDEPDVMTLPKMAAWLEEHHPEYLVNLNWVATDPVAGTVGGPRRYRCSAHIAWLPTKQGLWWAKEDVDGQAFVDVTGLQGAVEHRVLSQLQYQIAGELETPTDPIQGQLYEAI